MNLECVHHHSLFDFHLFPAAMHFPAAAAGHDKFGTALGADISFANLICHAFYYLPVEFD
jgi:hypothetical protein